MIKKKQSCLSIHFNFNNTKRLSQINYIYLVILQNKVIILNNIISSIIGAVVLALMSYIVKIFIIPSSVSHTLHILCIIFEEI